MHMVHKRHVLGHHVIARCICSMHMVHMHPAHGACAFNPQGPIHTTLKGQIGHLIRCLLCFCQKRSVNKNRKHGTRCRRRTMNTPCAWCTGNMYLVPMHHTMCTVEDNSTHARSACGLGWVCGDRSFLFSYTLLGKSTSKQKNVL